MVGYKRRFKKIMEESYRLEDSFKLEKKNKELNQGISVGIRLLRELMYEKFPEMKWK